MKTSNRIVRFVALIALIAQLLSLSMVLASASYTEEDVPQVETSQQSEETYQTETVVSNGGTTEEINIDTGAGSSETTRELQTTIKSEKFLSNEQIQIGFDTTDVVDYYYVADGVTVVEDANNPMKFSLDAEEEFGSIDVYAKYGNGELAKKSLYTYKHGDAVYVSDISKDTAWHNCMEEQYEQGLITMGEWEDLYSELSQTFIVEMESDARRDLSLRPASRTTTIAGKIEWETETHNRLPLRQTKIELRDKEPVGSTLIATTYTDNNGQYSFSFENLDKWYEFENGGLDVFIRVYAEARTCEVKAPWDLAGLFNYLDSKEIRMDVQTGAVVRPINYVIRYDTSVNINQSFYIEQGMVLGQRFATAMGMKTDNFIHVIYPSVDCAADLRDFIVSMGKEIGVDIPWDEIDRGSAFCVAITDNEFLSCIGSESCFDTIIHEYGHFVETSMGVYGPELLQFIHYGAEHRASDNNFDEKETNKYAMTLTWSEAWATVFSLMAQQFYSTEYEEVSGFADAAYKGNSFERYYNNDNGGEAQEAAVISFLWDLFDGGTDEPDDNIALGYQLWWNCTTKAGTYTLQDFANVIEKYYPSLRSAVGEIMGAHQISPSDLKVENQFQLSTTVPPTLSWTVGGSKSHPNNRFQVVFYDKSGNRLATTISFDAEIGYNGTCTFEIPSDTWEQVMAATGNNIDVKVAVKACYYADDSFVTGPYSSEWIFIHKSFLNIAASDRYTECVATLGKGESCDFVVTFAVGGPKLIQTFGDKKTKMTLYSKEGNYIMNINGNGYGNNVFYGRHINANETYVFRVEYSNANTSGNVKFAITPAEGTSYANILAIKGDSRTTTYSRGMTVTPNSTKVATFTPAVAAYYTFTIDSGFDSCIYVIDPRTSSIISEAFVFNDNSKDGKNPQLKIYLSAGVPYFIICSANNPASLTSTQNFTLNIQKNATFSKPTKPTLIRETLKGGKFG